MKRRRLLSLSAVLLSGCIAEPDPVPVVDVEQDVDRKDSVVVIRNLQVADADDYDCYHKYTGSIVNEGNVPLHNIDIAVHIYDRTGLRLSTIELSFRLLRSEQIQEFEIAKHGDCWEEEEAVDYEIEVS